ncbi:hypothetical protein [Nocardia yamanashiensis]|uniref:hypothetical protein n=1 Tax=Nocardia yamanashiensis TaxID=209247 RepID=UPI000836A90E|nr:hypothetical protein [Nocardia yamanashiensis]
MSSPRIRSATYFLVLAAAAAVAAGCADSTGTSAPGDPPPIESPEGPTVTAESAQHLCDMLAPDVGDWRMQGPTAGKVALNATVENWALRNNGVNLAVARNRSVVDQITTAMCPEVRAALLDVLQVPDLASGLVGF